MTLYLAKCKEQPYCRWCGAPIRKHTTSHRFPKDDMPTSREEAQRRVNQQIVSVQWDDERSYDENGYLVTRRPKKRIYSVGIWDGETYNNAYFCNGNHAHDFAELMAREGHCTKTYLEAMEDRRDHGTV